MTKTLLIALILSACSLSAAAQGAPPCGPPAGGAPVPYNSVAWAWTTPATLTDGTALTPPVTITVWEQAADGSSAPICQVAGGVSGGSWSGLAEGKHTWGATASTAADGESAMSNLVSKTVVAPAVILVDPAHLDAYSLLKVADGLVAARVGTVAVGTVCDKSQSVTTGGVTYYVVPKSFVTPQNPGATAIVARCL